jgi:hypothetical protein
VGPWESSIGDPRSYPLRRFIRECRDEGCEMGTGKPWGAGRQFRFEARCNWCESVRVERDRLHVFLSPSGAGLFEFVCPECERVNFRSLSIADLQALALVGIRPAEGRAPFELLEDRVGPPIEWDDLIDFHLALSRVGTGWEEPRLGGPSGSRALERDAA